MMHQIPVLYAQGFSCRDIAQRIGCCDESVRKTLRKLGIPRRPKSFKKPRSIPSWSDFFRGKTEKRGACILWSLFKDETGYGRTSGSFAPDITFSHRMSWFLANGDFDRRLKILHKCDVPSCVNPKHLFIGTQADNVRDMCSKHRQRGISRYGMDSVVRKLTDTQVKEMRALRKISCLSYAKIAEKFGVTTMTAHRAITGKSWSTLK